MPSCEHRWLDVSNVPEGKPASRSGRTPCVAGLHRVHVVLRLLTRVVAAPFSAGIELQILRGYERYSQRPMTVAYLGDHDSYHYLVSRVFAASPQCDERRSIPWWKLRSAIPPARRGADLLLIDLDFPLALTVPRERMLLVPRWVRQSRPVQDRWEAVLASLRRGTRRAAMRAIRNRGYRARVVSGADGAATFYADFYRPYVTRRFGAEGHIVSSRRFEAECRRGEVVQLLQGETVVSAVLVRREGRRLTSVWMGMHEGVSDSAMAGINDALDLYTLLHAYETGCDRLDLGNSRANLSDGVLRYKRKWGTEVSTGWFPKGSILVAPVTDSEPLRAFLTKNPWITQEGRELVGRILAPSEDGAGEELSRARDLLWLPGIDRFAPYELPDLVTPAPAGGGAVRLPEPARATPGDRLAPGREREKQPALVESQEPFPARSER